MAAKPLLEPAELGLQVPLLVGELSSVALLSWYQPKPGWPTTR